MEKDPRLILRQIYGYLSSSYRFWDSEGAFYRIYAESIVLQLGGSRDVLTNLLSIVKTLTSQSAKLCRLSVSHKAKSQLQNFNTNVLKQSYRTDLAPRDFRCLPPTVKQSQNLYSKAETKDAVNYLFRIQSFLRRRHLKNLI